MTALNPTPHEHSAAFDEDVAFLRSVPPGERPRPLVPALKAMFGLSAWECCEAIRKSHVAPIEVKG